MCNNMDLHAPGPPWTGGAATPITRCMLAFRKMHGLGNDFVVLDGRARALALTAESARTIADRRMGVGCDQILIMEPARNGGDVFMTIRNADGGEVESCGNGSRCVGRLVMDETGKDKIILETVGGPVVATRAAKDLIAVDMGPARDAWESIPLAEAVDTLHVPLREGLLQDAVAVNVGNPHAVFFVNDAETIDLAKLGPKLECHPLFPQHTNVEAVQVLNRGHVRIRVWERGVGITRACGTGACAATVAAVRRGLTDRKVTVTLEGGDLEIEWRADNHVIMTGPVTETFAGTLDGSLLG